MAGVTYLERRKTTGRLVGEENDERQGRGLYFVDLMMWLVIQMYLLYFMRAINK